MTETKKIMTSLQFPGGIEPYVINDARIPLNPAPYQQLVTGADGKWAAEERLAWKEEAAVLIPDGTTLTLEGEYVCSAVYTPDKFVPIVANETYQFTWDQNTMECVGGENGTLWFYYDLKVESDASAENYIVTCPLTGGPLDVTIGIKALNAKVHPISPEYLPEGIGYKTGEKVEITWDGNTEGLEMATSESSQNISMYRIYDGVLSKDVIKNAVLTVAGTDYKVSDMWSSLESGGYITDDFVGLMELGYFTFKDNVTAFDFVFPKAGYYATYVDSNTCVSKVVSDITTIHPIPAEYLPKTPVVNVTLSDDGETYTADKTYAEITAMLANGVFPVCREGNKVYPLVISAALNEVMPLESLPFHAFSAYSCGYCYDVYIYEDDIVVLSATSVG